MRPSLAQRVAGWILTVLCVVLLAGLSAGAKFADWEGKEENFAKSNFTLDEMFYIGVVEVVIALMLLVPQTAFLGAILVAAYLGGATVVHVQLKEPFIMPIAIGVLVWVALALRRPEIFRMAVGIRTIPVDAPAPPAV